MSTARRYAVIGDPVAHSLSPLMQAAAFAACGIDATYEAIRVRPAEMGAAMERLRVARFDGFNVTRPLKRVVMEHLDALTDEASAAGCVNTVRRERDGRYLGDTTDGRGFVRAIVELWGIEPAKTRFLILGAGSTASSIASALRGVSARVIECWARDPAAAAEIGAQPNGVADVVVGTLPADAQVPEEVWAHIGSATRVLDANYAARSSPIPRGIGGARSNGLPMLLHQGALAFEWWTGRPAPIQKMRDALGL